MLHKSLYRHVFGINSCCIHFILGYILRNMQFLLAIFVFNADIFLSITEKHQDDDRSVLIEKDIPKHTKPGNINNFLI